MARPSRQLASDRRGWPAPPRITYSLRPGCPPVRGAIFSSAVGSVLGAPRTLQALAMDDLAPRKLAGSAGGEGEPIAGLVVTIVIALGAVLLGDLNAVAPVVDEVVGGMSDVAQANGMAGLHSNTVLLGWPSDVERMAEYVAVLRRLNRLGKSVVLARLAEQLRPPSGRRPRIDVWWGGLYRNADLMLLLAHLLTRNSEWVRGRIRVLSLARDETMQARITERLEEVMEEARIEAELVVRLQPKDRSIHDMIEEASGRSDIVFLGLSLPAAENDLDYADRYDKLARNLRTVFLVHNASPFGRELVSPG